MVVCGISGRRLHAAAALAVDGRLVAAAEQAPLSRLEDTDGPRMRVPMAAIEACLEAAGLSLGDITHVVRAVGDAPTLERVSSPSRLRSVGIAAAQGYSLSRPAAFARIAEATGHRAAIIADGRGAMQVAADGSTTDLERARGLLTLTCRLATALGLAHDDSAGAVAALEQLALRNAPTGSEWFEGISTDVADRSAAIDAAAFDRALASAEAEAGAPLGDHSTPLVRKARVVADLAEGFLTMVAAHFGQLVQAGGPETMLAGSVFGSPEFVDRVRRAAGWPCPVAPCPSRHAAALGAALSCDPLAIDALPADLSLGRAVSEAEAKKVLENCRLDYIYEPQWPRLLERVSRVLQRGKLVAWFQGRSEFGHPFSGSRSFLCDPSNRYARDNINLFLRKKPVSTPIPVSIGFDARGTIDTSAMSPLTLTRAEVGVEWRDRLRAGVDGEGRAQAHVLRDGTGPLSELLAIHHRRTGVPGLANLPLCGPDDVAAISPRDAVRAAFGSSADALVIHRFIVMKDYWQLRDDMAYND
jgi:carbamoyltransferase